MFSGMNSRRAAITLAGLIGGAVLLWLTLRVVSIDEVTAGLRRMGTGFVLVLVLSGLRYLVRAAGWRLAMDDPRDLPVGRAIAAVLAGDALGNVTPLGLLASEPAKIWLVERRLTPGPAMQALVIETLIYTASVACLLGAGLVALLSLMRGERFALEVGMVCLVVGAAGVWMMLSTWWAPGSWTASRIGRLVSRAQALPRDFLAAHPGRAAAIGGLEILFHVLAIAEVYVTLLWVFDGNVTWLQAFLLESVNRFTTVVFKFVPLRLGVDEAGSGMLGAAVAIGASTGVAVAIVRKARTIVWVVVGLACLGWAMRRARARGVMAEERLA